MNTTHPDADLEAGRLRAALVATGIVPAIDIVDTTQSTNADLLAAADVSHLQVLLANAQTGGQGRLGRAWVSPPGCQVIFSVAVITEDTERIGLLPLAVGVAIIDALTAHSIDAPSRPLLKWPNDILCDGAKLGGILCQAAAQPSTDAIRCVLGVGLNHHDPDGGWGVAGAGSLSAAGITADRTTLATDIIANLAARVDQWQRRDPRLLDDYRAVCGTIGQHVRLVAPGGDIEGTVDAIADSGAVVVDGVEYFAGDIVHLRPAGGDTELDPELKAKER